MKVRPRGGGREATTIKISLTHSVAYTQVIKRVGPKLTEVILPQLHNVDAYFVLSAKEDVGTNLVFVLSVTIC